MSTNVVNFWQKQANSGDISPRLAVPQANTSLSPSKQPMAPPSPRKLAPNDQNSLNSSTISPRKLPQPPAPRSKSPVLTTQITVTESDVIAPSPILTPQITVAESDQIPVLTTQIIVTDSDAFGPSPPPPPPPPPPPLPPSTSPPGKESLTSALLSPHRFVPAPNARARYSLPYPGLPHSAQKRLSGSYAAVIDVAQYELPNRRLLSSSLIDRMRAFEHPEVIEKISSNSPGSSPSHSPISSPKLKRVILPQTTPPKRTPPVPPPRRKGDSFISDPTPSMTLSPSTPTNENSLTSPRPLPTPVSPRPSSLPSTPNSDHFRGENGATPPVSSRLKFSTPPPQSSSNIARSAFSPKTPQSTPPASSQASPVTPPSSSSLPPRPKISPALTNVIEQLSTSPSLQQNTNVTNHASSTPRSTPPPQISVPPGGLKPFSYFGSAKSSSPVPSPSPSPSPKPPPRGRAHTLAAAENQPPPQTASPQPSPLRNRTYSTPQPAADPAQRLSLGSEKGERPQLSRRNASFSLIQPKEESDGSDEDLSETSPQNNGENKQNGGAKREHKKSKPFNSTLKQLSFNSPKNWFSRSSSGHSTPDLEIFYTNPNSPRPISPPPSTSVLQAKISVAMRVNRKNLPQVPENLGQAYKVVREILETEADYADDLEVIIQLYMDTIRQSRVLTYDVIDQIFGNVKELQEISLCLLSELKEMVQQHNATYPPPPPPPAPDFDPTTQTPPSPPPPPPAVASLLFKMISPPCPFGRYMPYLQAHERAIQLVSTAMDTNPDFSVLLVECRQHPDARNLDLGSYLIKPVQRLCKYPLFLKELHKSLMTSSSPSAQSEAGVCLVAAAGIEALVGQINAKIDQSQKINGIKAVLESANTHSSKNAIIIKDLDKLLAGRTLLREGRLWRVKKTSQQRIGTYFLLDTIFLGVEDRKLQRGRQIKTYIRLVNISSVCAGGGNVINITYTSEDGKTGQKLTLAADSYLDKLFWLQDFETLAKEFSSLYEK